MKHSTVLILILFFLGCVAEEENEIPNTCIEESIANTTFEKVKNFYDGTILKIHDDLVIEGYIVSSDLEGNFYGALHFQDKPTNPSHGFELALTLNELHLFYPIGQKVIVKLKGLYLDNEYGVYKIGGVFNAYGNRMVGRLPAAKIKEHILISCEPVSEVVPSPFTLTTLDTTATNTLVQINRIELEPLLLGETYAAAENTTQRTFQDCNENSILLETSGYADFQGTIIPEGNGTITGVLTKNSKSYILTIRDLKDINLNNTRCNDLSRGVQVSIEDLKLLYNNKRAEYIQENILVSGVVISDIVSKNISAEKLILQDASGGIQLVFNEPHELPLNQQLTISLLGSEIEEEETSLIIQNLTNDQIVSSTLGKSPIPKKVTLEALTQKNLVNQLITIDTLQFKTINTAYKKGILTDCLTEISLSSNEMSLFANEIIPSGNGSITGVLMPDETFYIRNTQDINFNNVRKNCSLQYTSNYVFISEIADPDNSSPDKNLRFIELYNAGDKTVSIDGWELRRYTNANIEYTQSTVISLTGTIPPSSTYVIAANEVSFIETYGIFPNLEGGTGGAADSNGDDNIVLIDGYGEIIDVFGVIGEDGSATNHEFEDGRAVRNLNITQNNVNYTFLEWTIYNDTGAENTINKPQNAPEGFNAGKR